MWNTFRYAARQLGKSPSFSVTVLAALAICMGANTAIYTVVNTLFFRALSYPMPDRLVMLATKQTRGGAFEVDTSQDGREWETVRDHASYLDAAVFGTTNGVNLVAGGRVEYVANQRVSANFFHVRGINPRLGREFTREEDVPNGPARAILSYSLWRDVFAAAPSVVGRSIDLRGFPIRWSASCLRVFARCCRALDRRPKRTSGHRCARRAPARAVGPITA